jgi:hypothetical protein
VEQAMKIGIVSDIHAQPAALRHTLEDMPQWTWCSVLGM